MPRWGGVRWLLGSCFYFVCMWKMIIIYDFNKNSEVSKHNKPLVRLGFCRMKWLSRPLTQVLTDLAWHWSLLFPDRIAFTSHSSLHVYNNPSYPLLMSLDGQNQVVPVPHARQMLVPRSWTSHDSYLWAKSASIPCKLQSQAFCCVMENGLITPALLGRFRNKISWPFQTPSPWNLLVYRVGNRSHLAHDGFYHSQ